MPSPGLSAVPSSRRPSKEGCQDGASRQNKRICAGPADQLHRGGQAVFGSPARKRQGRPAKRVERQRVADQRLAEHCVADAGRRSDALQGRRQQEIEPVEELIARSRYSARAPLGGRRLSVGHGEAALDLDGDVLAVEVAVLGVELAMHVGDLAHERDSNLRTGPVDSLGSGEERRRLADACRDQRIGIVDPADRDADIAERIQRLALEVGHERVEQSDTLVDGARHRADVIEARRERKAACGRHEVVRGLEADHPATRRRDPDRSAGIRAERSIGEVRRERGGGTAARAARDAPRCKRVRHSAVVGVLRRDAVRELVQVRLADVRVPRGFRSSDRLGSYRRHVLREDGRAVGCDQPRGVEQVLDGERNTCGRAGGTREENPGRLSRNGDR